MATTQSRVRIGPADRGRRMTLDEFRDADEVPGYRYELARGVLDVVEVPGDDHWRIVDGLHEALSRYRRDRPGVIERIGHGSEVRFTAPVLGSDRHPDLAVVLRGAPLDDRGRRRADLAIGVVSEGAEARRRDFEAKREDYLIIGLLEYWIVDPVERRVTVLSRREGPGGPSWEGREFEGDRAIFSPLLPGFAGVVAALWGDEERGGIDA